MTLIVADYRELLKKEFESRKFGNPAYSLRAFARDLKFPQSRLSAIFKGREGLSRKKALAIAKSLNWPGPATENFCDLVELRHGRSQVARTLAATRLESRGAQTIQHLQMDAFRAISDWYHLSLRELVRCRGFRLDFAWLAKKLDVPADTLREAWERLVRLDVVWQDRGRWRARDFVASPEGTPSSAIRSYHLQVLEKARSALANDPVETRDFSSVVFPLAPDQLPEAKKLIREFRRGFSKRLPTSSQPQRIYNLGIQFFGLDRDVPDSPPDN